MRGWGRRIHSLLSSHGVTTSYVWNHCVGGAVEMDRDLVVCVDVVHGGGDASRHLRHCCWSLPSSLRVPSPGICTCCHEDKARWGWPDSFPEQGIAARHRHRGRLLVWRYMLPGQDISVSARATDDGWPELGDAEWQNWGTPGVSQMASAGRHRVAICSVRGHGQPADSDSVRSRGHQNPRDNIN